MMDMVWELISIAIAYGMVTNGLVTSDAIVPSVTNKIQRKFKHVLIGLIS